jgi:hypothetical protein
MKYDPDLLHRMPGVVRDEAKQLAAMYWADKIDPDQARNDLSHLFLLHVVDHPDTTEEDRFDASGLARELADDFVDAAKPE